MRPFTVDPKTGKVTPGDTSGLIGFAGWRRLTDILRTAGEIQQDEEIVRFVIDDQGVRFKIEKRS